MANRDPAPFWRLLLILFVFGVAFWIWLAVALLSPARAETIRNDMGGSVAKYTLRANLAALRGDTVVIDGPCGSACVLYLRAGLTTPNATLGFHSPNGGTKAQRQEARKTLARHMPPAMGAWYLAGPAKYDAPVWLTADQAVALGAKPCGEGK